MAMVMFHDRKVAFPSPVQALEMWEVLQGRQEPKNEKQAAYIARIERIYLNYATAPADYLEMYPQETEPERELSWYQK